MASPANHGSANIDTALKQLLAPVGHVVSLQSQSQNSDKPSVISTIGFTTSSTATTGRAVNVSMTIPLQSIDVDPETGGMLLIPETIYDDAPAEGA